jgi:UTP--glucose-1-phosphate uridylyltransferase
MEIPPQQTGSYGIIDLEANSGQFARIRGLVEKPAPEVAPSNMAIIGRYILTPRIFSFLENQHRGAGNEIQLTDAMQGLLTEEAIFGWRYDGIRYDCGNKAGFQMANIALALTKPELRRQLLPFLHEQLELWQ